MTLLQLYDTLKSFDESTLQDVPTVRSEEEKRSVNRKYVLIILLAVISTGLIGYAFYLYLGTDKRAPEKNRQFEEEIEAKHASESVTEEEIEREDEVRRSEKETSASGLIKKPAGEDDGVRGSRAVIRRSAIALAVENREPKDVRDRFSVGHGRVYWWAQVINGKGGKIVVRWVMKGEKLAETHLPVGSNSWRTWAYITLRPNMIGPVQIQILNEEGELLKTESFEIVARGQTEERDTLSEMNRNGEEPSLHREPWRSRPREP